MTEDLQVCTLQSSPWLVWSARLRGEVLGRSSLSNLLFLIPPSSPPSPPPQLPAGFLFNVPVRKTAGSRLPEVCRRSSLLKPH